VYPHVEIDIESDSHHARVVRRVGRDRRVLELGCATGYMSKALRAQGCEVVGVEMEPEAAARAAEFCARVIVADIESAAFEDAVRGQRFDVIVAADVLEHLKSPATALRAAKEHLVPGGCVVASVPNVAHGSVRLALLQGRFPYAERGLLDRTHLRFFTYDSLLDCLRDEGFVVTDLERYRVAVEESEVPFDPAGVPPVLLDTLAADVEATTYQFIVTAYPVPETPPSLLLPLTADASPTMSPQDDAWLRRRKALEQRLHEASAEIAWLRGRAQHVEALQAQIDAIRATRIWRLAAWVWRGEASARRALGLRDTGWPPSD
jgi:2-polyprenyl-3-methyl-5-hydroxy-6-metoxy-1,4-benzoquinol methylase